jgi:hypothetical protein
MACPGAGGKRCSVYRPKVIRVLFGGVTALFLVAAAYFGKGFYQHAMTIHELLGENKELKQAITTLTTEDQIGYAKVISQQNEEGRLLTTLRFVETSRDDKTKKILQKEYTIEGDVIHFDALIVKFDDQMVMDGKARALYLWRRVYGEKMAPEEGFPIEVPGTEPKRYEDLLKILPLEHQELFWSSIWDLSNNPEQLGQHGIKAIYGNVIYSQLREGLIYVFKIGPTGHLYVEDVFDM